MSYQINPDELEEIVDMGISHDQAVKALKLYKSKQNALKHLFPTPEKPIKIRTSIDDLNQAIQNSLKEQDQDYSIPDISNPESNLRFEKSPVGLKNIRNTCYFNSLIQTYFMIPKFIQEILSFKEPESTEAKSASIKLIEELQLLFASMILGNKKCIDPSEVLENLVDDFGNKIVVGEQKDIGEFNMNFIARIEDGLKAGQGVKSEVDNTIVSQLFFAKQHEVVKANERDGEVLTISNTTLFGQLSLDVNEKELHRAWDKAFHNYIEEFMTPKGFKTDATHDIWPEKLPGILLFQIQRVVYDPKLKQSRKINSEFRFPQKLYGDRYILKNKNIYLNLREGVLKIKEKIGVLEKQLDCILNYNGSGCSIIEILENVSKFLDTQQYSIIDKKKQIEHLLNIEDSSICLSREVIDEFVVRLKNRKENLIEKIQKLQVELEKIFDKEDLKQYKYVLHSILMHQGNAEAGHYFAYIYDIDEKVWRRYSDTYIKKVTSEEVMKNAIGNDDTSAYCLFYIYQPYIKNSGVFHSSLESLLENYSNLIPEHIKSKVLQNNDLFLDEVDNYKSNQIIEKIKRLYDNRFTQLVYWTNENSLIEKQLINFVMYLKLQRNEHLARWVLLDLCVTEVTYRGIEENKQFLIFSAKLDLALCKYYYGPSSLDLAEHEKKAIQDHAARFKRKYFHAKLNFYVFNQMTNENLLNAFTGILNQIENLTDPSDEYQQFCIENLKIVALRMNSFLNACIFDKEIEQGLIWANHLAFVISTVNNFDQKFVNFIKNRVLAVLNYMKKYLPGYYSVDVKVKFSQVLEHIEKFNAVETFDVANIDDKLKEALKPEHNLLGWRDIAGNFAAEYGQCVREYVNSFIFNWTTVLRRMIERGQYNERDIIEVERNIGIFEKVIW